MSAPVNYTDLKALARVIMGDHYNPYLPRFDEQAGEVELLCQVLDDWGWRGLRLKPLDDGRYRVRLPERDFDTIVEDPAEIQSLFRQSLPPSPTPPDAEAPEVDGPQQPERANRGIKIAAGLVLGLGAAWLLRKLSDS